MIMMAMMVFVIVRNTHYSVSNTVTAISAEGALQLPLIKERGRLIKQSRSGEVPIKPTIIIERF